MYLPQAALDVIKIFTLGAISFVVAFLSTPLLTHFLYKHKLWKKEIRQKAIDGGKLTVFQKFHKDKETNVPRMGGILIWTTVAIIIFIFWFLSKISDIWWLDKLNFLSRDQTWLLLFALIAASLLGLTDDIMQILKKGKYIGGGLRLRQRICLVGLIGLLGGWWFFYKLGWSGLHVPGIGTLEIGIWYIPLFVVVMLATYSGGVIDGLDGLAGGVFASIFAAFAGIALFLGQINVAAFCTVILGALLAFLWFNIPPARFYMGESGIMGLCAALAAIIGVTIRLLG